MISNLFRMRATSMLFISRRSLSSGQTCQLDFDSRHIKLKLGELARLADSSVTGQLNDTHVLVTIVNKPKVPAASFLPLTVDYMHKASAQGRIPQNFTRRDQGASNYEILVARMIDRSLRPLFSSKNYGVETQVVCNLLATSGCDSADVLAINAASYALYHSSASWAGPVGCVRVGKVDGELVVNPSKQQLEMSSLNIVLSVAEDQNIVMLEAWGNNVPQAEFVEALAFGAEAAHKVALRIKNTRPIKQPIEAKIGFTKQIVQDLEPIEAMETSFILDLFQQNCFTQLYDVFTDKTHDKKSRDDAISLNRNTAIKTLLKEKERQEKFPEIYNYQTLSNMFMDFTKQIVRDLCLDESRRVDGRTLTELRPIKCRSDLYSALHGSALFQRGQTQVLSTITFDSPDTMYRTAAVQDMMSPSITNFDKNFMLHYQFPGYAVNEIARMGGRADRREIGHGALAEKALYPIIPEDFPFTIRAHCEVLESNGSSSMASVCASSMALMDAGVPIESAVCGVAMGIITRDNKNIEYKILSDISGFEDYMGDMDFKVSGTANSITAIQADFKIRGLPMSILREVIDQSTDARVKILELMAAEIKKPRKDRKESQPMTKILQLPIEKRGQLIGPGGMNLRRISSSTGVTISSKDESSFELFAPNSRSMSEADAIINKLLNTPREPELEFGAVYTAKITEVRPSGLMVTFYAGMKPTLLPNNQIDGKKIMHGSASEHKVGQEIKVKYFGRDPVDGKMRISRKALFKTTQAAKDLFTLHKT